MRNAKVSDYEEILRVAQLYVDGCAKGDGEMMKPAFHQSATINGVPIQTLFDGATQAGPTDSRAQVDRRYIVKLTTRSPYEDCGHFFDILLNFCPTLHFSHSTRILID